jgi:hypothetical protein
MSLMNRIKLRIAELKSLRNENKGLWEVIELQREFIKQNSKLKQKRAMVLLNWLINEAKEKRYVLLDSGTAWQILQEDKDCIGLINFENPYKAVLDAFDMVERIAKGLAIEKKKIFDGKMWGLRYTPEKNKEPALGVLKSLSEKLEKGIISKFKKEPHPDYRFHEQPEEGLTTRELFAEYGKRCSG